MQKNNTLYRCPLKTKIKGAYHYEKTNLFCPGAGIAAYLNMSPRDFFDFDSENPKRLNTIIDNLKRLNDQQLAVIEALVKDLVQG